MEKFREAQVGGYLKLEGRAGELEEGDCWVEWGQGGGLHEVEGYC